MNSKRLFGRSLATLLMSMLCLFSFAQNRAVSGVVLDDRGDPVIGANIKVVGQGNLGTITDFDGNFSLSLPEEAKQLEISFIGYKSTVVNLIPGQSVRAVLQEDSEQLDEVVVIGYQTVRRRDLTGSVASVKGDAIAAVPVTNVAQALQGKLPGVNIVSQDGRPDAEVSIRVRGGGSISQSNDPLVLIDGIPGSISDIPGDMVESIDVLKDASSTAIYGARGANGVILVTTKKGKEGRVSVTYNGYAKFNTPTGYMDTMDPYNYLVHKWGVADAYFGTSYTTPFQQLYGIGDYAVDGGIDGYKNVKAYNLQKDVYNSSFSHNHDLSLTAGNDKTKVLFAVSYMDEDGMKLNSYAKRASASFKLDQKINNRLNFNLDVRYTDRETMGSESVNNGYGSSVSAAYRFRPITLADMKGDTKLLETAAAFGEDSYVMNDLYSPVAAIKDHDDQTLKQSLRGTAGINWTIIDNLRYRTEITLTRDYTQRKIWRGRTPFGNEVGYFSDPYDFAGDADYRKNDRWSMRWTNTLSYEKTLKNIHRINVLLGQEVTDSGGTDMRIKGERFPSNFTKENAFAMIAQYGTNLLLDTSVSTPNRILSYFGRANYSLMDKYMLTFTMRADGSSNFSPEHRWGYFPAAALAWRISEEAFAKDVSWLDDLKLRLSYGQVGNDAISANQWSQLWAAETDNRLLYGLNNEGMPSYKLAPDGSSASITPIANRDLKWETTITRNIGIDFTILNNRLWGNVDVYHNTTKDLLMLTDIPSITGFTSSYANIGQTSNKGVEVAISGLIYKNKDWSITAGANINFNKNNIDKLADGIQSQYGTQFLQSGIPNGDYILLEGNPVGIIMGYKLDGKGYYTTADFNYDSSTGMYTLKDGVPDMSAAFVADHGGVVPAGQIAYPGMPKFKDVSGDDGTPDGMIDEKDYVQIGNTNPKHTGGFNINVNYKNFDLGLYFNWSYGNDIYNANKLATLYTGEKGGGLFGNKLALVNDSYTYYEIQNGMLNRLTTPQQLDAANANAKTPSVLLKQGYVSEIGVEDGSYLRLNTLTLGYTLPKQAIEKIKINNIRVYGTIYNVFTLTGYSGLDPEVNSQATSNNSRYPTPGFDWGTYPRARQFVLGVNATF